MPQVDVDITKVPFDNLLAKRTTILVITDNQWRGIAGEKKRVGSSCAEVNSKALGTSERRAQRRTFLY